MSTYEAVKYNFTGSALTGIVAIEVGTILPWSNSTLPSGYLNCDGSAISRSTYSALFAVIGTDYGTGNGSSTFNLPDLQDKVPVGVSGSKAVASSGGSATATPAGSISIGAITPAGSISMNSITPSGSVSIGSITPSGSVSIGAITPAGSVSINAFTPSGNLSMSSLTPSGNIAGSTGGHTLSTSQIPSHSHDGHVLETNWGYNTQQLYYSQLQSNAANTLPNTNTGGGGSHSHNLSANFSGNSVTPSGNFSGSSVTPTGSFSGNSVTPSGSFSGNSVTPSGSFSGQSVTPSGSFSGNSVTPSGSFSGNSLSTVQPYVAIKFMIKI